VRVALGRGWWAVWLLFILAACDFEGLWESGQYAVYRIDGGPLTAGITEDGSSFHARVVGDILGVGINETFFVVETRPPDRDDSEFHVVEISRDAFVLNADEIVEGPYSERVYEAEAARHGWPRIGRRF